MSFREINPQDYVLKSSFICRFFKEFDSIHGGKNIEQIFVAYNIYKEIVPAIIMPNRDNESMVFFPNSQTYFFSIVSGALLGVSFAPFL